MRFPVYYCILILTMFQFSNLPVYAQPPLLTKIDNEQVAKIRITTASKMVENLLNGMRKEEYYTLSNHEAIEPFVRRFTPDVQRSFFENATTDLGNYNGDISLQEIYLVNKENAEDLLMFRFKGGFQKPTEIRVYYRANEDLLAGIAVTYWIDDIYNYSRPNN